MVRRFRILVHVSAVLAILSAYTATPVSAQTPVSFDCPVTLPNTEDTQGLPTFIGDGKVYREDDLWIAIPANGILAFDPANHNVPADPDYASWLRFKLHVHRGPDAHGTVEITGHRLDIGEEQHATNEKVVDQYYGESGFVPVSLVIPTVGCWELTASSGNSSATWVVDVRMVDTSANTDFTCQTTVPGSDRPSHEASLFTDDQSIVHGDGIWVSVPDDGVITLGDDNEIQFGTNRGWRASEHTWLREDGVEGFVTISGKRLDMSSELSPELAISAERQYVKTGAVKASIAFPSEGCWEVTASVDGHSVTWVMEVRWDDGVVGTPVG